MTFRGQSVISLVWGVVSTESPRGVTNPFSWIKGRFLRRVASRRPRLARTSALPSRNKN